MRSAAPVLVALVLAAACDTQEIAGPVSAPTPEHTPHASLSTITGLSPTLTVNSTNDLNDGTCDLTHCSLREALVAANAAPGTDVIHFNIPGAIPHTIQPWSALPAISYPVVIDGTTQPGFLTTPVIELDGQKTSSGTVGLKITGGNSTVRGLVINRFMGDMPDAQAIVLDGSGSNLIEGNFIGTDVTGTKALTNANVITIGDPSTFPGGGILVKESSNNTIGGTSPGAGNVVSGNYRGIQIMGANATGNLVEGNFVGTDVTGTVKLGNGYWMPYSGDKIYALNIGVGVILGSNNTIGGTVTGAGNLVSGNGWGVSIGCGQNNKVQGNHIGTDVTGTSALANREDGVSINAIGSSCMATGNLIGGLNPEARNVISGNGKGVYVSSTDGANVSGTLVQGNYIGTDPSGLAALPNLWGVSVYGSSAGNVTIGGTAPGAGNLISGNKNDGIGITNGHHILVQGNQIGTDATGSSALGNETGVALSQELGSFSLPRYNIIGGSTPDARNVISGNTKYGVLIGGGEENRILGNFIGTDAPGTTALPNGSGVVLASSDDFGSSFTTENNTIGGTTPGARNVISGNAKYGIYFGGAGSNQVLGNYIGTDASGTSALGNILDGVAIVDAEGNEIGDATDGSANLISGNTRVGVLISGSKAKLNKVRRNLIGTDPAGTAAVGNGESGVRIDQGSDNTVGGTLGDLGNVVAFNGKGGVVVSSGTGNAILSNSVFSNTGLGIDLGTDPVTADPDGMTPNDPGDGDTGPNSLQNFPVLTGFGLAGGALTVQGTLHSTALANFRVELFSSTACDPSGHGEGRTFLTWASVTTDGGGNATLAITLPGGVEKGEHLTATATDGSNNSSEFSNCIVVPNQPPVAVPNGPYNGVEGSPVSFDGTGSFDPNGDPLTYHWNLGDGTTADSGPTASHTYSDNGTYSVCLTVTDVEGASHQACTTATVSNVAPICGDITGLPNVPVQVGTSVYAYASFTDPGTDDTHTALWNWGDGTSGAASVVESNGSGTVGPDEHVYSAAGIYTVSLTVTDDDAGSCTKLFQYVVVYDPDAGFVTGGGWIGSPAGAYRPDADLYGKANFGFVSRYKKGATAPDGNTEFQFHAADLNFHSSSFDWLVVTGSNYARFKGEGTINGSMYDGAVPYKFMVWAGDGEPDTFRIRIWVEETEGDETVIYDNGFDQEIGGGSIVVHAG